MRIDPKYITPFLSEKYINDTIASHEHDLKDFKHPNIHKNDMMSMLFLLFLLICGIFFLMIDTNKEEEHATATSGTPAIELHDDHHTGS